MPIPNIEDVARKLTKAQRSALVKLDDVFTYFPISIARVTMKRLNAAGLVAFESPKGGFGMRVHRLTETGLAVRAHLTKEKNDGK